MSDKVIVVMDKPKNCENCVFGICKYSTPLSTGRKGYYCNLKEPKDITVEDFFYTDEVHLENCPSVSAEEHDKEIRNKAIKEFVEKLYEASESVRPVAWTTRQEVVLLKRVQEIAEQMKMR